MNPLGISIIIPVYNGESTLEECLQALFFQEDIVRSQYEVIVVDDGSTDRTEIISKRFDVVYKKLSSNQGRIVARETGAKLAQFEKLLFIDSRVIASANLVVTALEYEKDICYAGDLGEDEGEQRDIDKLFFILRTHYYKPYYPQRERIVELTQDNFYKLPKGTTCLLIPKDVFLKSLPEVKGKTVNDDTKIFHHILFNQQKNVYRSKDLKVRYLQRDVSENFSKWLIGRGTLYTSFYFKKKPAISLLFILSLLVVTFLCLFLFFNFKLFLLSLVVLIVGYSAISFVLGGNSSERTVLFRYLYKLILFFWYGACIGAISLLFSADKSNKS